MNGRVSRGVFDSRTKLSPANVQHSLLSMLVLNWMGCLNPAQGSAWCILIQEDLLCLRVWPQLVLEVLEVKAALYPFTALHVFFLAFSITAKCLLLISWSDGVDLFVESCFQLQQVFTDAWLWGGALGSRHWPLILFLIAVLLNRGLFDLSPQASLL